MMVSVPFLKTNLESSFQSMLINTGVFRLRKHARNGGGRCSQLQAWETEAGVLPERLLSGP